MSEGPRGASAPSRAPLLFAAVVAILLTWTLRLPNLDGWDDRFYVAQMVSMVADGDLFLHDDLLAFSNVPAGTRLRPVVDVNPARPGALANNFGIGPAMIHSFYLWPGLIGVAGLPATLRSDAALGSAALLVLTLLAIRALLLDLGYRPLVASACALAAAFGGPLAIYGTRLQMNSHLPSALSGALILLLAWRWRRDGGRVPALLLGLLCGLAAVVRFQDALVGLALAPFLLTRFVQEPKNRGRVVGELSLAAAAASVVLAAQALAFERHNGQIEGIPQGTSYVNWTHPQVWNFLFSPVHGLWPWTPLFALGLSAVVVAAWRKGPTDRRWFMASLAALVVLEGYVSAAPADWWGGSAFGARRLCTLSAIAALGLAIVTTAIPKRLAQAGAGAGLGWSVLVTCLFTLHLDDLRLVFTGQIAPESPFSRTDYPDPATPTWDALRPFLTDSFSLVDHTPPSIVERLQGALSCAIVCGIVTWLWQAFERSNRFRKAVAGLGSVWVLVWLVALWRTPSDEAANRAWFAMERGMASEETLANLPPEVAASGRLLLAWRAVRSGRIEEARDLVRRARSPQFPPIGLADLALLDEAVVRKGEH